MSLSHLEVNKRKLKSPYHKQRSVAPVVKRRHIKLVNLGVGLECPHHLTTRESKTLVVVSPVNQAALNLRNFHVDCTPNNVASIMIFVTI